MPQINSDGSSAGIDTSAHSTGNPIPQIPGIAGVTVGHTVVILVGILAALWLLGVGFRSVRL